MFKAFSKQAMRRQQDTTATRLALAGAVVLVALFLAPTPWIAKPAQAATLTVNSTGDAADAAPGNGVCATAGGVCTLRAAIQEANAGAGADTIDFNIPGGGTVPLVPIATALPAITAPVTIDGNNAGAHDWVRIDGTGIAANTDGLRVLVGLTIIDRMVITNFTDDGIDVSSGRTIITGNLIGIDGADVDRGNTGDGIEIDSDGNIVGGSIIADRNVISGNSGRGIWLNGNNNGVSGNYIGTNIAGSAAIRNDMGGLEVVGDSSSIGGLTSGQRNVISGNGSFGLLVGSTANFTAVHGNYIGTDASGSTDVGNANAGVSVSGSDTLIGGSTPTHRNVISGHGLVGVLTNGVRTTVEGNFIGVNAAGATALGNTLGIAANGVNTLIDGNVVSGNVDGIYLVPGATNPVVVGNIIGVDVTGSSAIPNQSGITVGSTSGTIGGAAGTTNYITGNTGDGIWFLAAAKNVTVASNFIGYMPGSSATNGGHGIRVSAGSLANIVLGGAGNADRNLIENNVGDGIHIESTATGVDIRTNFIDANGGLGIDLAPDGPTLNDPTEFDTGANDLQNWPVIKSAVQSGPSLTINSHIRTEHLTNYMLRYYATVCDASGYGEGGTQIGSVMVSTSLEGNAADTSTFTYTLPAGYTVTGTATNISTGSASEFSACYSPTSDVDGDGVFDVNDNCPAVPNNRQDNTDRNFIDHSPPFLSTVDDKTRAYSDALGDSCDSDDDNDNRYDWSEASCGSGSDPLRADTDADRFLDGAECALGTDPTLFASKPLVTACGATTDVDGDKITERVEVCFYGTDPNNSDTDGDKALDGAKDGCEAASFNSDRIVNVADMGMLATAIGNVAFRVVSVDVNKDGVWNPADQGLVASFISPSGQCPG